MQAEIGGRRIVPVPDVIQPTRAIVAEHGFHSVGIHDAAGPPAGRIALGDRAVFPVGDRLEPVVGIIRLFVMGKPVSTPEAAIKLDRQDTV